MTFLIYASYQIEYIGQLIGASVSKRRARKAAKRGAHQSVSGSTDVPLSAAQDRRGAFFHTLALADRGSDLLISIGERTRGA
jgi:hypothetical protein